MEPRFKKLKLLADAQVPRPVVEEIRTARISIETIGGEAANRPDSAVLQMAQQDRRVLLTLDRDFWDDRKHPLHTVRRGIIFVDESPSQPLRVLGAFGLVYGCFAKSYPLDWWGSMKVRAVVGEFEVKTRSWQGQVARYKMTLRAGVLVARECG